MISQGLLDLITIGGDKNSDHATSDGVDNISRTQSISEKNKKQVRKVELKILTARIAHAVLEIELIRKFPL